MIDESGETLLLAAIEPFVVVRGVVSEPAEDSQRAVGVCPGARREPPDLTAGRPQGTELPFDPDTLVNGPLGQLAVAVVEIDARARQR